MCILWTRYTLTPNADSIYYVFFVDAHHSLSIMSPSCCQCFISSRFWVTNSLCLLCRTYPMYKNMVNAECHINTITEHTGFMSLFQYIRNMRYRCNAWALHHLNLYLHASADSKLSLREHNTKWLYFIMCALCAQHI